MTPAEIQARHAAELYLTSALGSFMPWETPDGYSPQRELVLGGATHRTRIYRGGNRTGKTTGGAVDTALRLCDWHPTIAPPRHRDRRFWVVGVDWDHGIGEIIWPKLREWLPPQMIRHIQWRRKQEPEQPRTLYTRTGWRVDFKSADSGREKMQGAGIDGVWLDEEVEKDVADELRARLVDRAGHLLVTATPLNREQWLMDLEESDATLVVRASMTQAASSGIIDEASAAAYLDELSERQRRVRDLGDFAALEGLVYLDWHRQTHVLHPTGGALRQYDGTPLYPWPLPPAWPRYAAMDFGYANPAAVPLVCEDPGSGTLIVEGLLYAANVRTTTWAKVLQGEGGVGGWLPRLSAPLIRDHDAAEAAELSAAGVATQPAVKAIVPGIEAVERYLVPSKNRGGRPRLYVVVTREGDTPPRHPIVGRCDGQKLAWEIARYRYPERGGASQDVRDLPLKRDDHALDALRYLVLWHERTRGLTPLPAAAAVKTSTRVGGAVFQGRSPRDPRRLGRRP